MEDSDLLYIWRDFRIKRVKNFRTSYIRIRILHKMCTTLNTATCRWQSTQNTIDS